MKYYHLPFPLYDSVEIDKKPVGLARNAFDWLGLRLKALLYFDKCSNDLT